MLYTSHVRGYPGIHSLHAVLLSLIISTMYTTVRNSIFAALMLGVAGLFSSCVNPKELVYVQDIETTPSQEITQNYEVTIQKDDMLSVSVSSKQPELVSPFSRSELGGQGSSGGSNLQGYLVDSRGYIVLPIIGKIKAAGKTCTQLGDEIAAALRNNDYITDASVNVQITNFKFTLLGEVGSGVQTISGQRVTILEAVAMAGDLTLDGKRDITLIREKDGKREVVKLDLRDKEIINSPYYYLQQNDLIYVTPSDRKINTTSETLQFMGYTMTTIGFITAIIAIASM